MSIDAPDSPAIVLVRPQMGENIGAAARAMLNFGLTDLRLVQPRDPWPNQGAINMSSGAFNHFSPTLYEDLGAALADCHFSYATTARTRDMEKTARPLFEAADHAKECEDSEQKVAFVFGPERTGLENDDLMLCHEIVHIPTNPAFSSLNLGQSVLLICYQYYHAQLTDEDGLTENSPVPAKQSEFTSLMNRLEDSLNETRFFKNEDLRPKMIRNLHTMFMRSNFTSQEIAIFHGILSAFTKNDERKQ